jgi:transcriptional regulator with XRE-family HTH domain
VVQVVRVYDHLKVNIDKEVLKLSKRFATRLKQYRTRKGLTQEDMANFGFNYRHYQRLESGSHAPSLLTLVRLGRIFGVKAAEFLE